MKRTIAAVFVSVLALAALSTPAASAHQAKPKHCHDTYFAPQYLKIKRISAQGTGCTVARGLSLAYMRAVTMSVGAHSRTGHCFPAQSYGHCGVQQKGMSFGCFHFDPVPAKRRGLVRCAAGKAVVKFNVGS